MPREEVLYVIWGIWVAANAATYLRVRGEWEIVLRNGNPMRKVVLACAVTHSTIPMILIALWEEYRNRS